METSVVFDIGTILSITAGPLLTDIGNIYEILNYMTGDNLFTHQLPRVADEMKPIILAQYPQLSNVDASNVNENNWKQFLDEMIKKYGNEFPITPCRLWEHRVIDPQEEIEQMLKGQEDKIIIIDPSIFNSNNGE